MNTIFELLAKQLKYKNKMDFLENHLVYVFGKWLLIHDNNNIDKFPFILYNCETKFDFYRKYWQLLAPLIIGCDCENLPTLINHLQGKSPSELIQMAVIELLSYYIYDEISSTSSSTTITNNFDLFPTAKKAIFITLKEHIGLDRMKAIMSDELDGIILYLLNFLKDERNYNEIFTVTDSTVLFPKRNHEINMCVQQFYDCLKFIQQVSTILCIFGFIIL